MPSQLPVTIDFGSIPDANRSPQDFVTWLSENGRLFTEQQFSLFVSGATQPTSNVGPWLANNNEWRVWDPVAGDYTYQTLAQESLRYFVGSTTPDETVYDVWFKLSGAGQPIGIFGYYSGSWNDYYATILAPYMTTAAFNAAIAAYSTTAQMNTAISVALAAQTAYSFRAHKSAAAQTVTAGAGLATVAFDVENYDRGSNFAANTYTAPVSGIYQFNIRLHVSLNAGAPTAIDRIVYLRVNGGQVSLSRAQLNDITGGESITLVDQVELVAGQTVDVAFSVTSTGASDWDITAGNVDTFFSGHFIQT